MKDTSIIKVMNTMRLLLSEEDVGRIIEYPDGTRYKLVMAPVETPRNGYLLDCFCSKQESGKISVCFPDKKDVEYCLNDTVRTGCAYLTIAKMDDPRARQLTRADLKDRRGVVFQYLTYTGGALIADVNQESFYIGPSSPSMKLDDKGRCIRESVGMSAQGIMGERLVKILWDPKDNKTDGLSESDCLARYKEILQLVEGSAMTGPSPWVRDTDGKRFARNPVTGETILTAAQLDLAQKAWTFEVKAKVQETAETKTLTITCENQYPDD